MTDHGKNPARNEMDFTSKTFDMKSIAAFDQNSDLKIGITRNFLNKCSLTHYIIQSKLFKLF